MVNDIYETVGQFRHSTISEGRIRIARRCLFCSLPACLHENTKSIIHDGFYLKWAYIPNNRTIEVITNQSKHNFSQTKLPKQRQSDASAKTLSQGTLSHFH